VAPALVAGAIVGSHTGRFGDGALVAFAVLIAGRWLDPGRRVSQLLPVASLIARMLIPVAGLALAWALSVPFEPLPFADLAIAAFGAALVMALATWLVATFEQRSSIRIAVAGPADLARRLQREIELTGIAGYRLVGWIDVGASESPGVEAVRRLGGLSEISSIVADEGLDLIVHLGRDQLAVSQVISERALAVTVRLSSVAQLQEAVLGQISLETMDAGYLQYLMHPNFRGGSPPVKRAIDIVGAALALVLAAPLIAILAIAGKITGSGPVIVREPRVGARGRRFDIYRLRTSDNGLGVVLRRTRLDELPQIWNVLRGEMSLVGPRPEQPDRLAELERRIPLYDRRVLIAPGLTGWAQIRHVDGLADADSEWKLSHDLYYLKYRSTALDLLIMLQTPFVAAHGLLLAARTADESLPAAN
jgi:lipopolysaccharide/colanic/teichoic acid biosynthesis glycosyltransferase